MTTVLEIVRDAYRESNLIAIGTVPNAVQLEEGLVLLNRLRYSVYGTEAGEELLPLVIGRNDISRPSGYPWYNQVPDNTDWFVPTNHRLYLNLTSTQTVYLNPNPEDGSRFAFIDKSDNLATYPFIVNGNGRSIAGSDSLTFNTNGISREYFYRADLGDWLLIDPLIATDTWPFPEEFDDLFVIGLGIRLNPRYIVQTSPESVQAYRRLLLMFKARYRQNTAIPVELGLLRTPGTDRYRYWNDGTYANSVWRSGYPYPWGMGSW